MTTYVYRNGELVDKSSAPPLIKNQDATNVISDIMSPTRHMADGLTYDSKKKFRQATKDAGCVEVGDQTQVLTKSRQSIKLDPQKRREDIQRAIYDLRNRSR